MSLDSDESKKRRNAPLDAEDGGADEDPVARARVHHSVDDDGDHEPVEDGEKDRRREVKGKGNSSDWRRKLMRRIRSHVGQLESGRETCRRVGVCVRGRV